MSNIEQLISKYEEERAEGLNLIASENYLSPAVRKALASDLAGRYHNRWYGGSKVAVKIIETTEELAKKLFRSKHAIVKPLSGNICDLAVLFSFTEPGDRVGMLPFKTGGYPLGLEKFHRKRVSIPVDEETFEINVQATNGLIREEQVKLTILGSSFILFPHPVRDISEYIKDSDCPGHCVYDGAHLLGLIACGEFQDPLREGAEVLFGSTHKTLYGPQGGIILTNSSEHEMTIRNYLDIDLETGIGLVDNPHMNRIAALGIAFEELLRDQDYGKRVIRNSKELARALDERGVPVRFKEKGYTESHQILLDINQDRAEKLCRELEEVSIFIDIAGRIGVAEVTHRGMGESDMGDIAELFSDVFFHGPKDELKSRVRKLGGN